MTCIDSKIYKTHFTFVISRIMKENNEDFYSLARKIGCSPAEIQDVLLRKKRLPAWLAIGMEKNFKSFDAKKIMFAQAEDEIFACRNLFGKIELFDK